MSTTTNRFSPEVRPGGATGFRSRKGALSSGVFDCGQDRLRGTALNEWVKSAEVTPGTKSRCCDTAYDRLQSSGLEGPGLAARTDVHMLDPIHRIGQTEVCYLWNFIASEAREGEFYVRHRRGDR